MSRQFDGMFVTSDVQAAITGQEKAGPLAKPGNRQTIEISCDMAPGKWAAFKQELEQMIKKHNNVHFVEKNKP